MPGAVLEPTPVRPGAAARTTGRTAALYDRPAS
jgi:hypothetical protein